MALGTQLKLRATLGVALFGAGLGLGACGGHSAAASRSGLGATGAGTTVRSSTGGSNTGTGGSSDTTGSTTASTATAATSTHTIVGTTPAGATVTQTSTHVSPPSIGPNDQAVQTGAPLASTSTTVTGQSIDGIQCDRLDQLAYRTAAHLLVYVDGVARALPGAIGMVNPHIGSATGTTTTYAPGLCAYWLRTRVANGVITIDSPIPSHFTLGQLFNIWDEPLSPHEVAHHHGAVTVLIDGRRWHGDPRDIVLTEHEAIQLAVGSPVPRFRPVNWSDSDL